MRHSTVRVKEDTRAVLKKLAESSGESIPDVIERAVDALRRKRFLEGLAEDFERLRSDPEAWEEELREREAWECTLKDGLE